MAYIKYLKKGKGDVLIDAEFRIKCEKAIEKFVHSNDQTYEFPSSLTNVERAFVHNLAPKFGLRTKSSGNGTSRKLSLFKPEEQDESTNLFSPIELTSQTKSILNDFFKHHPPPDNDLDCSANLHPPVQIHIPTVLKNPPCVPPPSNQGDYNIEKSRRNLPIYEFKEKVIETIERNRVTLIHGSTGSGKTTQIPQYLMDLAAQRNQPCKILCTQPRRISAISSAERVCYERNVELGGVIGYQIRLDSRAQPDSNCIFLTPGVFLRYLMAMKPNDVFKSITHCIIDEAHEHAKENDFLLTSIREHMDANPNLKVIIMSATMDTAVFKNYFGGHCEEVSIFSKQYEVEEFYLDDVLKMINFSNKRVEELKRQYERGETITASKSAYVNEFDQQISMDQLDEETISYLDEVLDNMSTSQNPENSFNQFLYLVQNENIPVDYRHSLTKMTPLMIAVGKNLNHMAESLLNLKADPKLQMVFGGMEMDSIDLAVKMFGEGSEIQKILLKTRVVKNGSNEESYNKALINIYQDTILKSKTNNFILEESIDHDLLVQLVEKIHFGSEKSGAILIFLPGFDDIITLSSLIQTRIRNGYTLFMLHSSMKTDDQKNVFKPTYQGRRKIILSTNIAESSITIDDILTVIDSGREKQKSFDAISHSSSLRVQWISKASANQRRGRAGRLRHGYVYRIYSRDRYQSMLDVTIPELLRTSLSEVCLQTKLLINDSSSIEEFLLKCIAGPSVANIRQSIKYLQKLGALDEKENLTLLGSHLAHMPVDAKYGKMLIYAIIFRCLNPILSLISILSMGDQIFLLPISSFDRMRCVQWRKNVAGESLSDHYMMLRVFQMWISLKNGQENDWKFCEENFISRNHIEHVRGIRRQILAYLESTNLVPKNTKNLNENSDNWSLLKAVICAGLYPFIAKIERRKGTMYTDIDTRLSFHLSSVLCVKKEGYKTTIRRLPAEWAIFEEKNRVGRMAMLKCNTLLNSFTVALIAGKKLQEDEFKILQELSTNNSNASGWTDEEWEEMIDNIQDQDDYDCDRTDFKVDKFVKFSATKEEALLIFNLKKCLNNLITRFLAEKHFLATNEESTLIKTFARIVEKEDIASGMVKMDISENSVEKTIFDSRVEAKSNDFNRPRHQQDPQSRLMSSINNPRPNSSFQNQRENNTNWRQNNQSTNQMQQSWRQNQPNNQYTQNWRNEGFNREPVRRPYQPESSNYRQNIQSRSTNYDQRSYQAPRRKLEVRSGNSQKFIMLKVNSKKLIEDMVAKVVMTLEELNLKAWQFHKIRQILKNGRQVFIFFYSTHRNEFQGCGEVLMINENLPMQFHFRHPKTVRLELLGNDNFVMDIKDAVKNPGFQYYELKSSTGNYLISFFQPQTVMMN